MSTKLKNGGITIKADYLKINLFILNVLLPTTAILASFDVEDTCPHVTMNACPFVTLESGETIQYTPKAVTSDLDWLMAELALDKELPEDVKHYYCAKPACLSNPCLNGGTCEESETGFLCNCLIGYHGDRCENVLVRDCSELQALGVTTSGEYVIKPDGPGDAILVYCDMETDDGGWTVFQRRQDGSVEFYLYWSDYKHGFGSVSAEHWLGNDNIHRLSTQKTYELRVDLEDFDGETCYASYSDFSVASETDKYTLTANGYSGTAGDSLDDHSTGRPFSTRDRDNDQGLHGDCAEIYHGAWWYGQCHESNLNGQYLGGPTTEFAAGVTWSSWRTQFYSLKKTEMKMRPV